MPPNRRHVVAPRASGRQAVAAPPPAENEEDKPKRVKPVSFTIEGVQPVGIRKINMMVYGPYGAGKTTFAGSALDVPEMNDVLFVAADPGEMSLTSRRSLDVIHVNQYKQVARIYEYLVDHVRWRDEGNIEALLDSERKFKSTLVPVKDQTGTPDPDRTWFEEQRLRTGRSMDEPFMYRTVILDSISEIHKYLVYQFTGVKIGTTRLDLEIERMEEWQVAQEMFRLFVRSFRDLSGTNVIFVAAESIEPDMRNKKKNPLAGQSLPKLAGQAAGDTAGFIDIVGYLIREVGKDGVATRRLYLGAGYEGFISKHRFENLPDLDYIEGPPGPTMASLLDLARKDAELYGNRESINESEERQRTSSAGRRTAAANRRSQASHAATGRRGPGRGRGNSVRR